jgi:hypothetical protein
MFIGLELPAAAAEPEPFAANAPLLLIGSLIIGIEFNV